MYNYIVCNFIIKISQGSLKPEISILNSLEKFLYEKKKIVEKSWGKFYCFAPKVFII
jgi:hypothetical protein